LCQTTLQLKPIICENTHNGISFYYNCSASKTLKKVDKSGWEHQLKNTRPLSGIYVKDVLKIGDQNGLSLTADSFEFVDAYAMDTR
jgi:hypothetical protein